MKIAEDFDPDNSPLLRRLMCRYTQPGGVINVQQSQKRYTQLNSWLSQRFPIVGQLMQRAHSQDDSEFSKHVLVYQTPARSIGYLKTVNQTLTNMGYKTDQIHNDKQQIVIGCGCSSSPHRQDQLKQPVTALAPKTLGQRILPTVVHSLPFDQSLTDSSNIVLAPAHNPPSEADRTEIPALSINSGHNQTVPQSQPQPQQSVWRVRRAYYENQQITMSNDSDRDNFLPVPTLEAITARVKIDKTVDAQTNPATVHADRMTKTDQHGQEQITQSLPQAVKGQIQSKAVTPKPFNQPASAFLPLENTKQRRIDRSPLPFAESLKKNQSVPVTEILPPTLKLNKAMERHANPVSVHHDTQTETSRSQVQIIKPSAQVSNGRIQQKIDQPNSFIQPTSTLLPSEMTESKSMNRLALPMFGPLAQLTGKKTEKRTVFPNSQNQIPSLQSVTDLSTTPFLGKLRDVASAKEHTNTFIWRKPVETPIQNNTLMAPDVKTVSDRASEHNLPTDLKADNQQAMRWEFSKREWNQLIEQVSRMVWNKLSADFDRRGIRLWR